MQRNELKCWSLKLCVVKSVGVMLSAGSARYQDQTTFTSLLCSLLGVGPPPRRSQDPVARS